MMMWTLLLVFNVGQEDARPVLTVVEVSCAVPLLTTKDGNTADTLSTFVGPIMQANVRLLTETV